MEQRHAAQEQSHRQELEQEAERLKARLVQVWPAGGDPEPEEPARPIAPGPSAAQADNVPAAKASPASVEQARRRAAEALSNTEALYDALAEVRGNTKPKR